MHLLDNWDRHNNDKEPYRLASIRACLNSSTPPYPRFDEDHKLAAVAIVIRCIGDAADVLFIKRATVEGDPWSGQMAFPGGHRDLADDSLQMTAIRETEEETGIHLSMDSCCGRLTHQRPANRIQRRPLVVVPYVFGLTFDPTISVNHEVEEAVWASMSNLMDGCYQATEVFEFSGSTSEFEGYRLADDKFVWGLTYRMLQVLFEVLRDSVMGPRQGR